MDWCSKENLPKPQDLFLIKQDNKEEFTQQDHNDSAALFNQSDWFMCVICMSLALQSNCQGYYHLWDICIFYSATI